MLPVTESRTLRRRVYALAIAGVAIPLNGGLVAVLPLAYAALRDRLAWARTPVDFPLAAFMLWFILAAAISEARQAALISVTSAVFGVYCAFQLPHRWMRSRSDLMGVLYRWACVSLPVAAALGLYSYLFIPNVHLESFRRFTLGGELPGLYAFGLEVALLLALGAPLRRRWLVLSVAAGTFALIETFSRWALLGFGTGMLVWSILMLRRSPRAVAVALATVALALAITISLPMTRAILVQYLRGPGGGTRWVQALVTGFTPRTGFPERLFIWRSTLGVIRDHAWVGVGRSGFYEAYHKHLDPGARTVMVLETPVVLGGVYHAHNDILTVAADSGIPAAVAYVALVLVALIRIFSRLDPRAAPAAAAFVAILVHGLFDAIPTSFAGPSIVFWLVLAAALQTGEAGC